MGEILKLRHGFSTIVGFELSSGRQTRSDLEACGVRAARTERERGGIGEVAGERGAAAEAVGGRAGGVM